MGIIDERQGLIIL